MSSPKRHSLLVLALTTSLVFPLVLNAQEDALNRDLDDRVSAFLEEHEDAWRDMNIPRRDGELLYDIVLQNGYTDALEIGTSTGHSAIWIAWALSKTGGTLTTIEIDEDRYREALANFRQAGVSEFIDARLADAHELVRELEGPYDFVFSDADKGWYTQYFIDIAPKMKVGGCFTAHNVSKRGGRYRRGVQEFVDYLQTVANFETTVEDERSTGISISYKRDKATKKSETD